MASVNKVIILGNCGRDPEIRYLPSGKAVAAYQGSALLMYARSASEIRLSRMRTGSSLYHETTDQSPVGCTRVLPRCSPSTRNFNALLRKCCVPSLPMPTITHW